MIRINDKIPFALIALLLPGSAWSMESYLSISLGATHSNPHADLAIPPSVQIPLQIPVAKDRKRSNQFQGLTYGTTIGTNTFVEINYSDLGKILTFEEKSERIEIAAEVLSVQLRRKWSGWNKLAVSMLVGLSFWETSTGQPAQSHLTITELNTLSNRLDHVAEKMSGNSLKLGLSAEYPVTERWVLGLNYEYYDKVGNTTGLVDFNALSVGDLSGALIVLPTETSLDVLSISFSYQF